MDKEFYELAKQIDVMVVFGIIVGSVSFFITIGIVEILCGIYPNCKKLYERCKKGCSN